MESIQYSITIKVVDGPLIQSGSTIQVDAYEKIDVEIDGGGSAQTTVSAGALADVRILIITASIYDGSVTFQTSAANAPAIPLDGPVTLIGAGASSLFGTAPDTITFANTGTAPASAQVLVGRTAVA